MSFSTPYGVEQKEAAFRDNAITKGGYKREIPSSIMYMDVSIVA
jgi:hypothetical protein